MSTTGNNIRFGAIAAIALAAWAPSGCRDKAEASGSASSSSKPAATGPILVVSYQGQSVPVALGSLATTPLDGEKAVKLSDVWAASKFKADRSSLEFEFVGADGFKPSEKGCPDLAGALLDKGYIDPSSRNLGWEASFGSRRCYGVKNVATMNAHAPSKAPASTASAGKP